MVIILIYNCCSGSIYEAVLGSNRYDGSEIGSVTVISTYSIVHSGYDSNTMDNDIAVIQVATISFTSECSHTVMTIYIILLILKQINCFLCISQIFICVIHPCCLRYASLFNTPCSVAISPVSNNCHS
jgi:hypothetical protein